MRWFRNRRSHSSVLAFSTALVLALLAVLTNLATSVLPDSLVWARNGPILWVLVGFFALLSGILAWRAATLKGLSETESDRGLEVVRVDLRRDRDSRPGAVNGWVSVLDISLVNAGLAPVFLHEVRLLRIERHSFLNGTVLWAAVEPSANYHVEAPFTGDSFVCRISQAISPGEADRFTLTFDPQLQGMAGGQTLYIFDAILVAGSERIETPIGRFMVPDNSPGTIFAGAIRPMIDPGAIRTMIDPGAIRTMIDRSKKLHKRVKCENIIVDERARQILDALLE